MNKYKILIASALLCGSVGFSQITGDTVRVSIIYNLDDSSKRTRIMEGWKITNRKNAQGKDLPDRYIWNNADSIDPRKIIKAPSKPK